MESSTTEIPVNYTREAFTHPINLGVLLLATILGFLAGNLGIPVSLVLTMVCATELIYLGVVPRLPRFREVIKLRKLSEHDTEKDEQRLFKGLGNKSKRQYLVLRHLVKLINQNFEKLPYSSQGLLENIRNKVDDLLSKYLTLLDLYKRYELYMNTSVEDRLKEQVEQLEKEIGEVNSEQLKTTKQRRTRILKKRLKKFEIAKEKYLICETHLETIEDTIQYLYEQSMTMSNPEEIGFQLDNLLEEMEETTAIINDLDEETFSVNSEFDEQTLDAELKKAEEQSSKATSQRIKQ
ncbi:MAG TPA: hypothetical protein VE868_09815 [Balneolaceae bacterium]|nr:hypothetical protein [Balneolaceae bacterium]